MTDEALKRKKEFIRRQKGTKSEADVVAQRLTNIYRQLETLGDDATQRYNQMLIRDANPEVLASLKTIPGGEEVREYYNFLTHTEVVEEGENGEVIGGMGLLPKPEQMSPIWESFGGGGSPSNISRNNPIPMAVVNPIRASVTTTFAPGSTPSTPNGNVPQSNVNFNQLGDDVLSSFDARKSAIMQALNYIVIDSNIEKMHQNLKRAILEVNSNLDKLKESLGNIIQDTGEKAAFPAISEEGEVPIQIAAEKKSVNRHFEKLRKQKKGTKFSVETTDLDEEN